MNIEQYRTDRLSTRVTADIVERWQTRVIAVGLGNTRAGALAYLQRYGRGMGWKKAVKIAVHAEDMRYKIFAEIMWERAYELETGLSETLATITGETVLDTLPETLPIALDDVESNFPEHLRPGRVATLQPQNLENDLAWYTKNPDIWVQEKADGHRLLIFANDSGVHYQKRSLRLMENPPTQDFHELLQRVGRQQSCIIDGELVWLDLRGGHHRTAAQASTADVTIREEYTYYQRNSSRGNRVQFYAFDLLYHDGQDLLNQPYRQRHARLIQLTTKIQRLDVYPRKISRIRHESGDTRRKRKFVKRTREQNKEGVIFRFKESPYRAGKSGTAFRHKWLEEHELVIRDLTESTDTSRPFGAIVTDIGKVGTGFNRAEMQKIFEMIDKEQEVIIKVRSQGLTENGKLWHPRFIDIIE